MYKTHNAIKKDKRRKRILYLFSIIFILWFIFGLFLKIIITNNERLEKIGYSNIEINVINEILNKKDIKKIYKYDYIKILNELLVSKDFNSKKLTNYLDYYNKYTDITVNDLLFLINNDLEDLEYNDFNKQIILKDNFDKEKMNRYNEYYKKYKLSIDETIDAVNKDFDFFNIKYNKEYLKFLNKDYTIVKNLERYNNYYNEKKISINDTISEVNSNLDLKPYEDYSKANTKENEKILVNKYYKLDSNYEPNNLVNIDKSFGIGKVKKEVLEQYKKMFNDAKKENVNLYIIRGYISYHQQKKLYNKNKNYYEKPGFSESQTGYSIEIINNEWLNNNAYKYGFILRYPDNKKNITGYSKNNYYRYVGNSIAEFIYKNNISFEEYYAFFINQK